MRQAIDSETFRREHEEAMPRDETNDAFMGNAQEEGPDASQPQTANREEDNST